MSEHTPGPCPNCGVNASEVMPLVVKLRLQRDELLAALEAARTWLFVAQEQLGGPELFEVRVQVDAALQAAKGE